MEKNRTLKKLYELLLKSYKTDQTYRIHGLCYAVDSLWYDAEITKREHTILKRSLRNNKPSRFLHKELYNGIRYSLYWWPIREVEKRTLFLEKMINYVELPWYQKLWNILK